MIFFRPWNAWMFLYVIWIVDLLTFCSGASARCQVSLHWITGGNSPRSLSGPTQSDGRWWISNLSLVLVRCHPCLHLFGRPRCFSVQVQGCKLYVLELSKGLLSFVSHKGQFFRPQGKSALKYCSSTDLMIFPLISFLNLTVLTLPLFNII